MSKLVPKEYKYDIDKHHITTLAWGEPSQPLILCIHGWLDNAASFWRLGPLLKNYFVVAVDLMGQGHSEALGLLKMEDYFTTQAALMASLIAKISPQKKAIVIAHSVGTVVANYLAVNFPVRVTQLVFIDALGLLSRELSQMQGLLKEILTLFLLTERARKKTYTSLEEMIQIRIRLNSLQSFQLKPLVDRGTVVAAGGYQWSYDINLSLRPLLHFSEKDARHLLSKIKVPVLLIWPSKGIIDNSTYFEEREKAITALSIQKVRGAGHHAHLSHPKTVARLIQEFLKA
jgi:pimeloyl-ACP methyl ester carboxylesterase